MKSFADQIATRHAAGAELSAFTVYEACALARRREEVSDYEGASQYLLAWWNPAESPQLGGLDQRSAAELLLRAGTLQGWLGSVRKTASWQRIAESLLTQSMALFQVLGEHEKAAEAKIELGYCYYREGVFPLAKDTYLDALKTLEDTDDEELQITAMIRLAIVERHAGRLKDALQVLQHVAGILTAQHNHFLCGRFYAEYATTLKNLGTAEKNDSMLQHALKAFDSAIEHFRQAGNIRYSANMMNNLGYMLLGMDRSSQARPHLDEARSLFDSFGDAVRRAQVEETISQLLITEQDYETAATFIESAVETLRGSGEDAVLAEALTTQGLIYSRLNRGVEARYAFTEALHMAERCGDREGCGRAALSQLDEAQTTLSIVEQRELWSRAHQYLGSSQQSDVQRRLREIKKRIDTAEAQETKERELHFQQEKMAALGTLAFGVGHDINNYLTAIKGRVQLIQRADLDEQSRKSLTIVLQVTEDCVHLIERIKEFGRPRATVDFEPIKVSALLADTLEISRSKCEKSGVSLQLDASTDATLMGDRTELREVLVNLIYNSIDSMAERPRGVVALSANVVAGKIRIEIADNGAGMTKEVMARAFEPFFTTKKNKGTGMGLAVSYAIVKRHDGTIEVDSTEGKGTIIGIVLPAWADAQTEPTVNDVLDNIFKENIVEPRLQLVG
ncbi:MAG: ATP-binding protein [Pyrinomonadaceae bacterium]